MNTPTWRPRNTYGEPTRDAASCADCASYRSSEINGYCPEHQPSCENCGRVLSEHDQQRYCLPLVAEAVAEHLRTFVGRSVEIESVDDTGKRIGAGPQLLIGVTDQSDRGIVYADFVEGWSIQVTDRRLRIKEHPVSQRDHDLFRECYVKAYYPGLPLNDHLLGLINATA